METWLPIPGFGDYEVSDLGGVRRTGSQVPVRFYRCGWKRKYLAVNLGRGSPRSVSRLVLLTFRGKPPTRHEARHLNGVHDDNRLDNLAWGTRQENELDKRRHNTWWRSGRQKLTPDDVQEIRKLLAGGMTQCSVADLFGVKQPQINRIKNGKTWKFEAWQPAADKPPIVPTPRAVTLRACPTCGVAFGSVKEFAAHRTGKLLYGQRSCRSVAIQRRAFRSAPHFSQA